jgi:hypothetical protein
MQRQQLWELSSKCADAVGSNMTYSRVIVTVQVLAHSDAIAQQHLQTSAHTTKGLKEDDAFCQGTWPESVNDQVQVEWRGGRWWCRGGEHAGLASFADPGGGDLCKNGLHGMPPQTGDRRQI